MAEHSTAKTTIKIDSLPIRLGQFLKYTNVVSDGLEAKYMIINEKFKVNGSVETRRGRKLHEDDTVQIEGGETFVLVQDG